MRHASPQLPLVAPWIAHAHATDLAAMRAVLDERPRSGLPKNARTGRPGLSGEQTLRLLLVRQYALLLRWDGPLRSRSSASFRATRSPVRSSRQRR